MGAPTAGEVVTYLEMTSPDQLRPGRPADVDVDMVRVGSDLIDRYSQVVNRVAAPHGWNSLQWSPQRWHEFFGWRDLRAWLIQAAGEHVGVLATAVQADGNLGDPDVRAGPGGRRAGHRWSRADAECARRVELRRRRPRPGAAGLAAHVVSGPSARAAQLPRPRVPAVLDPARAAYRLTHGAAARCRCEGG